MRRVRFLDIDLDRPDFQTLRAAQELVDDDQPILFPGETGMVLVMRFSATNRQAMLTRAGLNSKDSLALVVAEDFDLTDSASYGIPVQMADVTKNRAYHTLVQLCDAPLLTLPAEDTREEAAIAHPEVEYAFWPLR